MKSKIPVIALGITTIALAASTATFGYKYYDLNNTNQVVQTTETTTVSEQKDTDTSKTTSAEVVEKSVIPVIAESKMVNKNDSKSYDGVSFYGVGDLIVTNNYATYKSQLKYSIEDKVSDAMI